jgi:U3 small nucleolar RNA-associated protein 13
VSEIESVLRNWKSSNSIIIIIISSVCWSYLRFTSPRKQRSTMSDDDEDTPMSSAGDDNSKHSEKDDKSSPPNNENDDDDDSDDDSDDDDKGDAKGEIRTSLSQSWAITSSHVPTFTGGKVTHCKTSDHPFLLMPVHGDLAVVDAQKGTKVTTLRGDEAFFEADEDEGVDNDAITSFALDGKDQTIITCSRNNLLRQYSITKELKTSLKKTWGRSGHTLPVTNMEFHPSSVFLATGSVDGSVRIWDARGGFVTHVFRPVAGGDGGGSGRLSVTSLRWRNEIGKLVIAIGRDDGSMAIHDLRDTDHVSVLRDHVSAVTCMDWWGDQFFVSTGRDAILNLWRIVPEDDRDKKKRKKKKPQETIWPREFYRRAQSLPVYEQVEGMTFVPSEKKNDMLIVTAGSKGVVRLWKARVVSGKTPELAKALEQPDSQAFGDSRGGYTGLSLNQVAASSGSGNELIVAVDAEHNLSFLSSKLIVERTIVGHNDEILDLKTIPRTESIVVATNSPQVRIFKLGNFSCDILDGHEATVLCVATSPCGRLVASCGKDKTMRLWNVETRKCVGIAIGHTEPIGACGLSQKLGRYEVGGKAAKNGGGAFCVTGSIDRTLKRWNLRAAEELAKAVEPDELLASAGVRAHDKDINVITIAPNDSLVATGSQDKTVKLWNATDLTLKATIKGHRRGVWDCQFSPIDRVLATSSGDKTVKLWSLGDYTCLRTFQGHLASVLRVRFLKTGLQLMSAGADGLIKLWTVRTNECEATLDNHTDKVWALDMSSDGRTIVSGGADSKLNVWEDNTQQIEETTRVKEAESILLDQQLANHLRYKEYGKALAIALQIEKPMQALKVFTAIVEKDLKEKKSGLESLQTHAKTWNMERVAQVLKYCRDWNTRARNAHIAMLVVKAIVTTIPVDRLSSADGVPEILAGITPYAERHFERLNQLHTSTYLVDYTLSNMGIVESLLVESSEKRFVRWEASSTLVLPPKYVDGRIQIGGKAIVGKADWVGDSSDSDDDEQLVSIGDSGTSSNSSSSSDDDSSSCSS